MKKMPRAFSLAILGVLAVEPIYLFLSVFAGKIFGGYEIWRVLPSIVIFATFLAALAEMLILDRESAKKFFKSKLNFAILLFLVLIFLTFFFGDATFRAKLAGAAMDARFLLAFLAARILAAREPIFWKKVLAFAPKFLAIFGAILAIFGLLQITLLPRDFLVNFGYHFGGVAPYVSIDNGENLRAFATLAGPNNYANYLIISLFSGIFLIKNSRKKIWWILLVLIIAGIFASSSRGAWLAAIVALTTYFLLGRKIKFSRKMFFRAGIGLVLIAISGFLLLQIPTFRENILHIRDGRNVSLETSNEAHVDSFVSGVSQIAAHPLGCGVGCAGPASYYSARAIISENYYLQIAQEFGILGAATFLAVLWLIFSKLKYVSRENLLARIWLGVGAGLAIAALFAHTFTDEAVALTWFALAGAILTAFSKKRNETSRDFARKSLSKTEN